MTLEQANKLVNSGLRHDPMLVGDNIDFSISTLNSVLNDVTGIKVDGYLNGIYISTVLENGEFKVDLPGGNYDFDTVNKIMAVVKYLNEVKQYINIDA